MEPRRGEHHYVIEYGGKRRYYKPKSADVLISGGTNDKENRYRGRPEIHKDIEHYHTEKEEDKVSHRNEKNQNQLYHECNDGAKELEKPNDRHEKEENSFHFCSEPFARGVDYAPAVKIGIFVENEIIDCLVHYIDKPRRHKHKHKDYDNHRHVFKRSDAIAVTRDKSVFSESLHKPSSDFSNIISHASHKCNRNFKKAHKKALSGIIDLQNAPPIDNLHLWW